MGRSTDRPGISIAFAAIQRVDQGEGPSLDLAGCVEAVEHPTNGAKRSDLVEAIAYLAAQVVGYQNDADRVARLAMSQVRRVVAEYDRRHGGAP